MGVVATPFFRQQTRTAKSKRDRDFLFSPLVMSIKDMLICKVSARQSYRKWVWWPRPFLDSKHVSSKSKGWQIFSYFLFSVSFGQLKELSISTVSGRQLFRKWIYGDHTLFKSKLIAKKVKGVQIFCFQYQLDSSKVYIFTPKNSDISPKPKYFGC